MIGSRVLAAATLLALVVVLGEGGPRPEVALGADAAIVDAADRALAAAGRLASALSEAIEAARDGAARVVAGEADPAERLAAAANGTLEAAATANVVRRALDDLERARAAFRPDVDPLPPSPDAFELQSIAGQLDAAAESGAGFADMRRRAQGVTADIAAALEAAADGRLDEADEGLMAALVAVDEVRGWEDDAPVLAVWIGTADAMIRAMQRLVDAVRAGDVGQARAAREAFDAAAEESTEADRSLRIGLGEAGTAQTAVPLNRLASVLVELDELRSRVGAVRAGVDE